MSRLFLLLMLAAAGLAALHAARLSHELPDVVISHFAANGRPNGFMPRALFVEVYAGVVGLLALLFGLVPLLLGVLPSSAINLPNRDVWLDPARRDDTIAWIQGYSWAMGAGVILFLAAVMQLAARANLDGSGRLEGFPLLVGLFLGWNGAMLAAMIVKFTHGPS